MARTSVPDLWDFMLEVYGRNGVAAASLELQNSFGVDVPLLLSVLYGAGCGRRIDADVVASLDARCGHWRTQVVHPLRALRTRLKTHSWMVENNTVPAFREEIKRLELHAEKIQTQALGEALAEMPATKAADRNAARLHAAALCAVEYFAGSPLADMPSEVAQVGDATWDLASDWAL